MAFIPDELEYSRTHEWVKKEGSTYLIGLSDFAQAELGDIVFINLPGEDEAVVAGEPFADVESVKAVSDVYSPVTGTIIEVNDELADNPALINEDPYEAWIIRVSDVKYTDELLSSDDYADFCGSEKE